MVGSAAGEQLFAAIDGIIESIRRPGADGAPCPIATQFAGGAAHLERQGKIRVVVWGFCGSRIGKKRKKIVAGRV